MMRASLLCGCLLVVGALSGCGERWDAYVYPDKGNLKLSAHFGPFASLQECRSHAKARLYEFSGQTLPGVEGDYECGKNCKADSQLGGIAVCEETLR